MPDTDLEDVERALGSVAHACDRIPRLQSPKLSSVKPGSTESYYMLATFCFDAARKMEYVFKALRPFAERGDPDLAREIKSHNDHINAADLTWEERARRAESVMLELFAQIGEDHEDVLNRVARGRGR
jgi:hypothetical protein